MSRRDSSRAEAYAIEIHQHRFAAWAASRAASVKGCRFTVEQGRTILEKCGFDANFARPAQLPKPDDIDAQHQKWRIDVIAAARSQGVPLAFTHGVAAKLINVYLKSRFVCAGHHAHARVRALHPPIDAVLLKTLADANVGGHAKGWQKAATQRWSKFGSDDYQRVIDLVRQSLEDGALWTIEEHWQGNQ
jgi:hypothetical protein